MGNCVNSSHVDEGQPAARVIRVRKPRPWRHGDRIISTRELSEMRSLFWRQAPRSYGGRASIWEALQEAAACDELNFKQAILDTNSIRLGNPDMTVCFDDDGHRYELPLYVLSDPTNLERDSRNIISRMAYRFRHRR